MQDGWSGMSGRCSVGVPSPAVAGEDIETVLHDIVACETADRAKTEIDAARLEAAAAKARRAGSSGSLPGYLPTPSGVGCRLTTRCMA